MYYLLNLLFISNVLSHCTKHIIISTVTVTVTISQSPTLVPLINCSWNGHCLGDSCVTFDDCDGDLVCGNGICIEPSTTVSSTISSTISSTVSSTTEPTTIPVNSGSIPILSGKRATLTTFNDTITQCYGTNIPPGNALAINPLLLGFTVDQWTNLYANAEPSMIPWCGKTLTLKVKNESFTGIIADSCDPVGNPFTDSNSGLIIGGRCDYVDILDLYDGAGLAFLKKISNGDDFYQGNVDWKII